MTAAACTPDDKVPLRKLLPVFLIMACEVTNFTFVFPLAGYMVRDFGLVHDLKDSGYYAGMVVTSFMAAQFAASFVHGVLADRIGRRPVLLIGSLGITVTTLCFGLAPSFPTALLCRALCGMISGVVGVAKAYVSDVCNEKNEKVAFSYIAIIWGAGCILGPVLGGLLAHPVEGYPSLFSADSIFKFHPYLLPSLVIASFAFLAFVFGLVHLDETLTASASIHTPGKRSFVMWRLLTTRRSAVAVALFGLSNMYTIGFDEATQLWAVTGLHGHGLQWNVHELGTYLAVMGCFYLVCARTTPYFDRRFGSSFLRTFRIGTILCCMGMLIQPLAASLGRPNSSGTGGSFSSPLRLMIPNSMVMYMGRAWIFTTVMSMVSNSCDRSERGAVNGLGQAAAALARCVGPYTMSVTLAWSNNHNFSYPFNFSLYANICVLAGCGTLLLSHMVTNAEVTRSAPQDKLYSGADYKTFSTNSDSLMA